MSWYEQWFDTDEYELLYRRRDAREARTLIDLILRQTAIAPGASVLDVGCGRGRHSLEFARRGYAVTGLDLSARSLEVARQKALEAGEDVIYVEGDMREPVPGRFDLVVNLFTAFGYFEEPRDHQRVVDAMAGVLNPGGQLVQDFLNPAWVRSSLVPEDVRHVGAVEIRQRRRIEDGRIVKRMTFVKGEQSHAFHESVALLEKADFERLYESAGITLENLLGDYEGAAFGPDSPRQILFARKPAL